MLAMGAAALVVPRSTRAADARIEILLNEPIGTISPNIYSHFVEHLGGVVYDGIWVGEKSKVPNYNGIRKALVDNLKKLKPGVIRYFGGCFADQYDWRDGVGPRDKRQDKQVVLTVVNPHHNQARETEIAIRGGAIKAAEARTLTFAPASVTRLLLTLS